MLPPLVGSCWCLTDGFGLKHQDCGFVCRPSSQTARQRSSYKQCQEERSPRLNDGSALSPMPRRQRLLICSAETEQVTSLRLVAMPLLRQASDDNCCRRGLGVVHVASGLCLLTIGRMLVVRSREAAKAAGPYENSKSLDLSESFTDLVLARQASVITSPQVLTSHSCKLCVRMSVRSAVGA